MGVLFSKDLPIIGGIALLLVLVGIYGFNGEIRNTKSSQKALVVISPTPSPKLSPSVIIAPKNVQTVQQVIPSPKGTVLSSSVCPVKFTVSNEKVLIQPEQFDTWQLKDRPGERFIFVPRSEENNGNATEVELRGENQVSGNGETAVVVRCQDNGHGWSTDELIEQARKTEGIADFVPVKVSLWGRDVYKVKYRYAALNDTNTVWLFATPTKLFNIEKFFWTGDYTDQADSVFSNLVFN